jgi:cell division protein FtsZ
MIKKKIKTKKVTILPEVPQEEIKLKRTKIRVIGIGEGGSSIVSEIASRIKKATFWAANTNHQALKEVNKNVTRFQFGESLTRGLGTGMNPEIGQLAALAEKDKIKKIFLGQDLCVIVACLGGGTGSGAGPIFAKIARSTGCLTYGIFTMPFSFEGQKKAEIAKAALEQLKPRLHAFSVIPNEKIFQIIGKETPLRKALSAINERLAKSLEGLIEIIYEPGLINIDFADLRAVLEGQGRLTYLNTVDVPRKEGMVQEAIEKLLNSPLYPYSIRGARGLLYNIAGGKYLALSEVSQISKTISELVNKEAKIIFGISQNQKYEGRIKTTLLATGCGTKIFAQEKPIKIKQLIEKPPQKKESKVISAISALIKSSVNKKAPAKKIKKLKTGGKKVAKIVKKAKVLAKSKPVKRPQKPKIVKIEQEKEVGNKKSEARVRKNAVQLKKEAEETEAGMLAREKIWETPAFLRRKKIL